MSQIDQAAHRGRRRRPPACPRGCCPATANAATTRPAAPAVPAAAKRPDAHASGRWNRLVAEAQARSGSRCRGLRHADLARRHGQSVPRRRSSRTGAAARGRPPLRGLPLGFACTGVDPVGPGRANCSVGGYPVSGYAKTISGLGTIRLMLPGQLPGQLALVVADGASTSAWIAGLRRSRRARERDPRPTTSRPTTPAGHGIVDGQANAAAWCGFAGQTPRCVARPGPARPACRLGVPGTGDARPATAVAAGASACPG